MPEEPLEKRPRILLAEDDDGVRHAFELSLGRHYRVTAFPDHRELLKHLEDAENARDARLVLSDLRMPGTRDGLELAAALQQRHPGLPLVMMSGNWTKAERDEASKLGARETLEKPINLTDLFDAIERHRRR